MSLKTFIRSATAALALAALSSGALASPEEWQQADEDYQAQRFASALATYERMATHGDARAAEMAGQMHALGEKLYGDAVRRNPARAYQWLAQAARAGRPVAAHMLRSVNLASAAPVAGR